MPYFFSLIQSVNTHPQCLVPPPQDAEVYSVQCHIFLSSIQSVNAHPQCLIPPPRGVEV